METSRYIIWNVSPEIVSIGPVTLRWYGLLFALGFLIGLLIMQWIFRVEGRSRDDVDRLFQYVVIGSLIGARLGHCLFYDPGYYLAHPVEILKIWKGGLASHGTGLGLFVALFLYARNTPGQSYLWILDRLSIATALAGAFIRVGNLFNSEILGKPTDLPWALVFTRVDRVPRHPVMLYESLAYVLVFMVLLSLYRRRRTRIPPGLLLGVFLTGTFGARFLLEFVKVRQAAFGHEWVLSMGQLLSIPLILLGAWLLYRSLHYGNRRL
jgi:phosphatidylglycerol---prolipoprotein diacylglyceryl transferase